ncbi:sensor histidine kinase [Lacinutrix chionoecetis]
MIEAPTPENERDRQRAIESYDILDTFPEESYDNITELMCYIAKSPISLITLLDNDRNYIKSNCGFPYKESPRNISFCGHAIHSKDDIMIVEDARKDERFHDNPLVSEHKAIFYAGVPLVNPQGFKLGTLCVYDHEPRTIDEAQKKALIAMSKQVVFILEQRLHNKKLEAITNKLEKRNEALNRFAGIVSHDLKSPLANIISLTELLEEENHGKLTEDSITYLTYLKSSSVALKDYIDGLLDYYKCDDLLKLKKETVVFKDLMLKAKSIAIANDNIDYTYSENINNITINKSAVLQILVNLITNAVKYNRKDKTTVNIAFTENDNHYLFAVKDNASGIPKNKLDSIFNLFTTLENKDKHGNTGTGIGLASVKKLVESQGGEISVVSQEGVGSTFTFSIEK